MTDAVEGIEDEFRFARERKDTCFDESDKETNPAKPAEILHQIGLNRSFLLFSVFQFLLFATFHFQDLTIHVFLYKDAFLFETLPGLSATNKF